MLAIAVPFVTVTVVLVTIAIILAKLLDHPFRSAPRITLTLDQPGTRVVGPAALVVASALIEAAAGSHGCQHREDQESNCFAHQCHPL